MGITSNFRYLLINKKGTVTSIALTVPSILSVSGSPLTSSGTFAITTAVTPTGTGAIVLQTSPTLVTPTLGVASGTSLNLTATGTSLASLTFGGTGGKKISLFDSANNFHQYLGFGVDTGVMKYQVESTATSHVFYAGTSTTTSSELFKITGTGVVNIPGLTASFSVHTDSSKNLVSVQNNGTGLNILQTSPTLVTPNIGVASGSSLAIQAANTSITLRSTGESESVFLYLSTPFQGTAVNKTAIISQGINAWSRSKLHLCVNGVADNSTAVSVSDARLTVDVNGFVGIGVTSPTSRLHLSGNASLYDPALVINESTHASSRRVGINLGTGWTIGQDVIGNGTKDFFIYGGSTPSTKFYISTAGNIGIGTTSTNGRLQFDQGVQNRKIVLYENANNDHQYYGFGINAGVLRYQSGGDHVFYYGASSTTSSELMRIASTGAVTVNGTLTCGVQRRTASWGLHEMTGSVGLPNNTYTVCGNWGTIATSGDTLTYNSGTGQFTNSLGRTVYVTVSLTIKMDGLSGRTQYQLNDNAGRDWAIVNVTADDWANLSATIRLNNGDWFRVLGYQGSGFGQNMLLGRLQYVIS